MSASDFPDHPLQLTIATKTPLATDIVQFELRAPDGAALPEFSAGAHLNVLTPAGVNRKYSLCNDPHENDRYVIAVKREAEGRGGSRSMVEQTEVGQPLRVSPPQNDFALVERATQFILIAGGIGITPILSMARYLKTAGTARFKLYYLCRDAASTAFLDELSGPEFHGQVKIHHDQGDPAQSFDLWPVLEKPSAAHVYCCGPRGLMDAVRDMSGHWPSGRVHFESFGVSSAETRNDQPFQVQVEGHEPWIDVAAGQTLLEALRGAGHRVPSSCESGSCGSCRTTLVEGEAEHRDFVLAEHEQDRFIMPCVSRARSPRLVVKLDG